MKKGIIMEILGEKMTIMTPEGSFETAKKKAGCEVGQEVSFASEKFALKLFLRKPQAAIAGAAAALLIFGAVFAAQPQQAYAYVNVDINPSVELSIDKNMFVIEAKALNGDAESVMKKVGNWKGKPLSWVVDSIVKASDEGGFLKGTREVLVTTTIASPKEKQKSEATEKAVEDALKRIESGDNVSLSAVEGKFELREEAKKLGISPGKYAILKAAEGRGIVLDDQAAEKSISEIAKEAGGIGKLLGREQAKPSETKAEAPKPQASDSQKAAQTPNEAAKTLPEANEAPKEETEKSEPKLEAAKPVFPAKEEGRNGNGAQNQESRLEKREEKEAPKAAQPEKEKSKKNDKEHNGKNDRENEGNNNNDNGRKNGSGKNESDN